MVPTVCAGPRAVGIVLQLEVLVEVGGRLPSHLLQSARSELVARPPLCSFLLLPAIIDKVSASWAQQWNSGLKCELSNVIIELLRRPLWECEDMEVPYCAQNNALLPSSFSVNILEHGLARWRTNKKLCNTGLTLTASLSPLTLKHSQGGSPGRR